MSSEKKKNRENFRNVVFERDKHKCVTCGVSNVPLDAHHIMDRNEMPNGGYVKENGISLCYSCHLKAEKYHISNKTEFEPGYHPADLYRMIKSDYEKAVKASDAL
jgi:5-methylcytosine-specific restriction endonuclease McrA